MNNKIRARLLGLYIVLLNVVVIASFQIFGLA